MKSTKSTRVLTICLGVLAVLIVAVYFGFAMYFSNHYWYGTTINGMDVSGKTVAQVEGLVLDEVNAYQIEILEERTGQTEIIRGAAIDLQPVYDGSLERMKQDQPAHAWIVSLFRDTHFEEQTMVGFDEQKLAGEIDGLACLDEANVTPPEDAHLSGYSPETGFAIIPEVMGNQVDRARLEEELNHAISGLYLSLSLEDNGCYLSPQVYATDERLNTILPKLNHYANVSITYTFGGNSETLDGSTISEWLQVGEGTDVVIDQEKASAYVGELASRWNTAGKPKSLATTWGPTVTITKGTYGWRIDRTAETAKLLEDLNAGESMTREPVWGQKAASFGANDYGNTYVEINLTAQHLHFYKDGARLVSTDIVTGNLAQNNGTRLGAFSIAYKQRDTVLRGPGYASAVSYWMPFDGGIGLHDATWRSKFGGTYYKTSGSHGCVNMPFSAARAVYENIAAGVPVFVYELPGTEQQPRTEEPQAQPQPQAEPVQPVQPEAGTES